MASMEPMLDNMLLNYYTIKSKYNERMTVAELEWLISELKKHNENFQKALDLAVALGGSIKVSNIVLFLFILFMLFIFV
jgi:hypothetical protein